MSGLGGAPLTMLITVGPPAADAGGDTSTAGGWDVVLLRGVNTFSRATPWLHNVVYDYATYGVALFAVLLVFGWAAARRSGDPVRVAGALWAGLGTVVAVGINQPIVNAVAEPRPYTSLPTLLVLADRSRDFSFPSDHAVMAGAVAAGLLLVRARLGVIASLAAVFMAFARVYIAAHYPHDVLAGLALGAAVVGIGWALGCRALTRAVTALARTRLRPMITTVSVAAVPSRVCQRERDWAEPVSDGPVSRPTGDPATGRGG